MPAHDLQDLAEQFCAAMGAPAPELEPHDDGSLAFSTTMRDVEVTVAHDPVASAGEVMVYVFFGHVPADREMPVLRELMHANVQLREPRSPVFGRDEETDRIVLKYACPLADATGEQLRAALAGLVALALEWREGFTLTGPNALGIAGRLA